MNLKVRKFEAPWCAPCKQLTPILKEVAEELNIEVEVIDAAGIDPKELAAYGNIVGVPTLQLVKDGQVIKTVTGLQTKDQLKEFLKI